jgi:hypothetical protein
MPNASWTRIAMMFGQCQLSDMLTEENGIDSHATW